MPVPISNVTRRVVYAPSGAGGAGPYAFTFEILANTDIAVFKDDVLLTLTTHYTVSIAANGTGSVTITAAGLALAPLSPTQYAIVGNRTISRSTDFTTGGDFFANTLNDELDQQTIFAQQNAEGIQRALVAPQTDPTTIDMTLPRAADRANKTLSFDANGDPTLGISAADVANAATYATNASNSATAAASSASAASSSASAASGSASTASTQASNASTSASSATSSASSAGASASTAGTQASNASTSASNAAASASTATTQATNAAASASTATTQATNAASSATSANTAKVAAEAARDSALAAYDNFDDRYLGPYASNPTVDNDGNALLAGALYFNTVVPEMRLYTGSAWVAAYVSGTGFLTTANNLSELTATASTARTNLGLAIGTDVQAYDGASNRGLFRKTDPTIVAWTKTGAGTATTSSILYIEVNGNLKTIASGTSITMPTLASGTDYAIWAKTDGSLEATSNHTSPPTANARYVGGFHYAPGGNATAQTGGDTTTAINAFSFWDLKWRPVAPDPRGMTLVGGGFWSDIYLTGVDAITNGSSKFNVTIADGSSPPKVPTMFGGNGSTTYGTYTWFECQELATAFGKRNPMQQEYMSLAYGTTEASSGGTDPASTILRAAYTSKWGVMLAAGNLFVWGRERGGPFASAAWNANTEGRGSEYNAPNSALFGGYWDAGALSGSRCSTWGDSASLSSGIIGSRFVCDHLQLD